MKPFSETCQVFSNAQDRGSLRPGRENPSLCTSVFERFPEWSERITQLLQSDVTFGEICSDYEELAQWLAAHCHDDCTPESECLANRQLLVELEAEILRALQAPRRDPPAGPAIP